MSSASTGGTEGSSPASSPASAASQAMSAPKYGTLVPNRIFVGGISASTSEAELAQLFSTYGNVKATKIILDRAGVSKGYGFVTFETEEEAKRLQQESECIILRERKLNIAPAIKKQPFNRSFDGGSGSPPAVPTSPYYYTNGQGMGLPYQNGLTFYNAGAPAPGTPLAPPTDPTAIYQAAGVFGPQAASAHQTYAPMMYPCPAPSLAYMPQQYQYSPMPYESYYAGAAGAPQYVLATSTPTTNGTVSSGNTPTGGSNNNGPTGATSPAATGPHGLQSLPPAPTHYYTTTTAPPTGAPTHHHHHHHPLPSGPGTPQQLDHPYYNFTAAGPLHQPPSHSHHQQQQQQQQQQQHGHIGIGDQQLLLFTTDAACQQSANNSDGQTISQEDTRSVSSHSEQPQSGSNNNNNETTHVSTPSTPLIPIMPIKYPISNRYTNYHPLTLHPSSIPHNSPMCPTTTTTAATSQIDTEEPSVNPMHCRAILYQPVFIQNPYNTVGTSLLPTPPHSTYDSQKIRDGIINHTNKSQYIHARHHNGYNLFSTVHQSTTGLTKSTTKYTLSRVNNSHNRRNNANTIPTPYITRAATNSSFSYKSPNSYVNVRHNGDIYSSQQSTSLMSTNTRRNLNSDFSIKRNNNSYINNCNRNNNSHESNHNSSDVTCKLETGNGADNIKPLSPPPAPYSPMTRPLPNLSPPNLQVQFYTAQSRYQSQSQQNHHHQHQQQQPTQYQQQQQQQSRRYGATISSQIGSSGRKSTDKFNTPGGGGGGGGGSSGQGVMLRNNKFKVNGMMPNTGKSVEEGLGGAGDAQQTVGRMPLTPPGTPHNLQDSNQINDACHQMQTLTL